MLVRLIVRRLIFLVFVLLGLSLITFGFAVYKFFQFELKDAPPPNMLIGPRGFGLVLIVIGLLSVVLGMVEQARDLTSLRRQYVGMPKSLSGLIGIVVAALGLFALVVVVVRA